MKYPTTVERESELEVVVRRTFNGPADLVFEAWSRPELLMRWWLPTSFGMTFVACDADVRTGGTYRFVFRHPDFEGDMAFFGRYTEVKPGALITWTNEEEGDGPITTVTFEEQGDTTLLTLRERYPTREALDEALAAGSSGTAAAPDQFALLDEVLLTLR